MRKVHKTLRAMGYVAPVALTFALAVPVAKGYETETTNGGFWSAKEENTAWVTRYDECWQSTAGPKELAPCFQQPPMVVVRPIFELNKYEIENVLNREEIRKIDEYVDRLNSTSERERITVVGHTDTTGSESYNFELGLRRAETIRDYIIAQGYPAENVAPAESRGETEPLPEFAPDAAEQRRVTLTTMAL
ncbi:MAG: OmpA family protein [Candidatus Thiosymbion ectosymbiont of Robbea hypermnestra]|nr:OmpA family protein [Candidatus Thiosymbion ectosymbiont of Robbea hypermnestra]